MKKIFLLITVATFSGATLWPSQPDKNNFNEIDLDNLPRACTTQQPIPQGLLVGIQTTQPSPSLSRKNANVPKRRKPRKKTTSTSKDSCCSCMKDCLSCGGQSVESAIEVHDQVKEIRSASADAPPVCGSCPSCNSCSCGSCSGGGCSD